MNQTDAEVILISASQVCVSTERPMGRFPILLQYNFISEDDIAEKFYLCDPLFFDIVFINAFLFFLRNYDYLFLS